MTRRREFIHAAIPPPPSHRLQRRLAVLPPIDNQSQLDHVDVSNGRIRPLRLNHDRRTTREELQRLERDTLLAEMRSAELEQRDATRGLLMLRMEQFRLRHEQMIALLEFLQAHRSAMRPDTLEQLESAMDDLSHDLLSTIDTFTETRDADLLQAGPFVQVLDLLEQQSLVQEGATDTQLSTLQVRVISQERNDETCCSICRRETEAEQASMSCNHWHCRPCLVQWLEYKNACPVCRLAMEPEAGD